MQIISDCLRSGNSHYQRFMPGLPMKPEAHYFLLYRTAPHVAPPNRYRCQGKGPRIIPDSETSAAEE
eukprot:scaffold102544_cov29-Prasinocladus_malaysianus.AAC.2